MKKRKNKKLLKAILAGLLAVIIIALVVFFWHLPGHLARKEKVTIAYGGDSTTLMSCNLRCLTPLDLGERSWFKRSSLLMEDIAAAEPEIIGFQEATRWQYKYMVDCLEQYDSVITYRDKSPISEGCPIFYNKELYELVDKGSFWLSETPETMSRDWGSACYRICSYVILTDKETRSDFVVFNTHLDHVSDEARINGINVVLDKIEEFGGLPAVIMGDFNAEVGSATYEAVTENFIDAACVMNADGYGTYQSWGELEEARRIDYFMISTSGVEVKSYSVIDADHDGVYASDHNPIVMDAEISG